MTDLILDDTETMVLQAPVLEIQSHDLVLDSPERRKPGGTTSRRALVHDQGDGLTINFNGDYPGGVTINGVKHLVVHGDIQFVISHQDSITATGPHQPPSETVSLADVIKTLRQEIAALQAKVG